MTGFANLTMAGSAWTLSGAIALTEGNSNTVDVQAGTLTVAGALDDRGRWWSDDR